MQRQEDGGTLSEQNSSEHETPATCDVVIAGAGFAGLYMLYKLRGMGFDARCIEAAPDVGGVWYWNTYPGARCDAESLSYSYSFSDDLQQDWVWPERFSAQPEILKYAQHVADRFDLRRDITFQTRIESAVWDENSRRWTISMDNGAQVVAATFISAVGCLSAARIPDFPGLQSFTGEWYHTGEWPREPVDFSGKRVGVIGTGSSGVQIIPIIAESAADLTVFQRTPTYSVPARNGPIDPDWERHVKENYTFYRDRAKREGVGLVELNPKLAFDVPPEERQAEFRKWWDFGGPLYMFAFRDLMVNRAANDEAADFLRARIADIVKDPATADLLSPKDYPIGAKRICVDTDYFATYNRDNVHLIDVRSDPISEITPAGLKTESGHEWPLDTLVFATGYDAMTGAILRIDIRGRNGQRLTDAWADGPKAYLGVATAGFPNFYTITGPGSPSVIGNVIQAIEQHVEWIATLLDTARAQNISAVDVDVAHQERWVAHVNEVADQTLFPQANSWYCGANIPGKPRIFMPYVGGLLAYRKKCDAVRAQDYEGFVMER